MNSTIGIVGTGDMGSAVGGALLRAGYRVITALEHRSAESRKLARRAGLEDCGSLDRVLGESDIFLSILPPAAACEFASQVAGAIAETSRAILYADCNAVAPETLKRIEALFAGGSAEFVDVGIVGQPPGRSASMPTRFYVAGAQRDRILSLKTPEIAMIDMGPASGRASAIKMCYAALNKGVDALFTDILLAARRLDVESELRMELDASQSEAAARMVRRIPYLAATAARYTGEMREIAQAFDAAGVSGDFHRGAAWLYDVLARSSLSAETRDTLPDERSLDEALAAYAAVLEKKD